MLWLAIGVGGGLGAIARHGVNVAVNRLLGSTVPYATALVNMAGCLAVGVLAGLVASGSLRLGDTTRAFVFVGILGGFTTFSSFGLDTLTLVRGGALGAAFANVALHVGIGLPSVFLGYWLGHLATSN